MEGFKPFECERIKHHQALYKVKTPPWKDAFRQRCFERLRSNRRKLVDKFRNVSVVDTVIDEVVEEENLNKLIDNTDSELDEYLKMVEEIQRELIAEEKRLLDENYAEAESESLNAIVDWLEKDEIICPICQKYGLDQKISVIFCRCGFHIDTQQDGFSLQNFKTLLHEGIETHEKNCLAPPSFSLLENGSISNLVMICKACNFMYIVI